MPENEKYEKLIKLRRLHNDYICFEGAIHGGTGTGLKMCYSYQDGHDEFAEWIIDGFTSHLDVITTLIARAEKAELLLEPAIAGQETLQKALTAVTAERDAAIEENDFRKAIQLTPIYTSGGHGYGDDDDEDFWCPICREHIGTHRGFETTCPRCDQSISPEYDLAWDYATLKMTAWEKLPTKWHGIQERKE